MNKKGKSEGRLKPSKPSERSPKGKSASSGERSAKPAARTTRTLRSAATTDGPKPERFKKASAPDRTASSDRKSGSAGVDRKGAGAERRGPSSDRRSEGAERRGEGAERRGPSSERRGEGAERRGPSSERRGEGAERRGPSNDRKGPSTERKGPSTERKGPGAERKFKGKDEKHYTGKMRNQKSAKKTPLKAPVNGPMRLNKYIANSGVCSRRDADVMIGAGVVTVNDVIITELGAKVNPGDVVKYDGQTIKPEAMQYVLLNKPKNFTTSLDDALGRRSVMGLIKGATREIVIPVGKLDRDTTGLLLFTNDASLATRLMGPSSRVRKIYHVTLAEKVKSIHLDQIRAGIEIEGYPVKVDEVSYVGDGSDAREVGLVIYSSKHNIAKSIFEHFGYTVTKLDRVIFAGLTKKDLPRGRWRLLSKEEIGLLYMTT
jgi:23S rRNA pseudouridine2605 synthase